MGNLPSLAPPVQLQIWPAQGGRAGVVVPTLTKQLRPAGSMQVTTVTNSPAVSALDLLVLHSRTLCHLHAALLHHRLLFSALLTTSQSPEASKRQFNTLKTLCNMRNLFWRAEQRLLPQGLFCHTIT